jgi:hypothetical protein
MSKDEPEANPYAAPAPSYVSSVPATSGRPGWYTFYCIMAIVLGSLGAANGVIGLPGLFVGQFMQKSFTPPQPANAPQNLQEIQEIQQEMNQELFEVQKRYFWFSLVAIVALLIVGVALLLGGIWALQMKRAGAGFLGTTFMAASVFDVLRLILVLLEQMESSQIARKHLGTMLEKAAPPGQPNPFSGECVSNSIAAFFGGVVCFMVCWTIFKLWLYLSGWIYFKKPDIQAMLKD